MRIKPTPPETLESNTRSPRRPTKRQVGYLMVRCKRRGLTAGDLIREGVKLGRLHSDRSVFAGTEMYADDPRPLYELTAKEVGSLFEIVHAWNNES